MHIDLGLGERGMNYLRWHFCCWLLKLRLIENNMKSETEKFAAVTT